MNENILIELGVASEETRGLVQKDNCFEVSQAQIHWYDNILTECPPE